MNLLKHCLDLRAAGATGPNIARPNHDPLQGGCTPNSRDFPLQPPLAPIF